MRRISLALALCTGLFSAEARAFVGPASSNVAAVQQFSDGLAEISASVKPGVVAIVVQGKSQPQENPFRGTPFGRYFRMPEEQRNGEGSGVVVNYKDQYYILTNNHVIQNAAEIEVITADDRKFSAETLGTDPRSDLALLKVEADNLPAVELGDSDKLREGELVLAIGNPFGYEHTITTGIVSALGRARFGADYGSFIQTDAAVNPGNSGGALVNTRGQLIGINTAIASRSGGNNGLAFAIPVNLAKDVMQQLVEHGEVRRGLLGVVMKVEGYDQAMANYLGLDRPKGVVIDSVTANSAADKAGIEKLDVILAVDDQEIKGYRELRNLIGGTQPGTKIKLKIWRDKKERDVKVTLGQLGESVAAADPVKAEDDDLGLEVQDLNPTIAQKLGYDGEEGVLIRSVKRGSKAARKLQQGDLIQEINRKPIRSVQDYKKALAKVDSGEPVLLQIRRGDRPAYVALEKA